LATCGIALLRETVSKSGCDSTAKVDCRPTTELRYLFDMDILKMLSDLRQEREQIGEAIITLERLAAGSRKRRGRPPAWMANVKEKTKRRGRPPGSKNKS
jgi:hypothetical protein